MRRSAFLTLVFLLLIAGKSNAQYTSLDLTYGNAVFNKDFLGQLNTTNHYKHGRPMQYMGLMLSGTMTKGSTNLSGNFIAAQYLPQQFYVNDSLKGNISGSLFGLTAGADVFPKVKAFDLILSGGMNLGRMKLVQEQLNYFSFRENNLHLKNMMISPKFGLMAKMYIGGRFSITLNTEYAYDISGSKWREKLLAAGKPRSASVDGFNQSGINCSIGVGWVVPVYTSAGAHSAFKPAPVHTSGPLEEGDEE
jgi:hypothetical protein